MYVLARQRVVPSVATRGPRFTNLGKRPILADECPIAVKSTEVTTQFVPAHLTVILCKISVFSAFLFYLRMSNDFMN